MAFDILDSFKPDWSCERRNECAVESSDMIPETIEIIGEKIIQILFSINFDSLLCTYTSCMYWLMLESTVIVLSTCTSPQP